MSYSSYGPFKARKGSLPDHSDDSWSRSRSEFTNTESSPPYSTWTDTFSPEPKSLPIDPPDGIEGETSRPSVSSERVKGNVQTLVVKLPPEKPNPSKNKTKLELRRRSKSLESIVLTKKTESSNENNTRNTSDGEVKNYSEKKDKQKKAKNTLKAVFAGLKLSKRVLLATARPVSSTSIEPTPKTTKQSETKLGTSKQSKTAPGTVKQREPTPGTSQQSKVYVRQSVKESVAAQSARATHSSKETKNKAGYKIVQDNYSPGACTRDFQWTLPPAPGSPNPIVKVNKNVFYLTDDGTNYARSTINCTAEVDHTYEDRIEKNYIDAACAEERRPPVKKVLFLDSSPNELEVSFYSESSNIADNSYCSLKLPHIDSEHQLNQFEPLSVPSTSNGFKNFDYGHLEIFEPRRYEHQNPKEDFSSRPNQSYRLFSQEEIDFERRNNALRSQLQEDRLIEQHLTNKTSYSHQISKPESAPYKDDYNKPLKKNKQRLVKETFIQSSNGTIRRELQQDCPPTVYNQHQHRPSRRQDCVQAEPCLLTTNDYEPRRALGQTQDRRPRQSKQQDIQADQPRSREINQPRKKPQQRTVQKKKTQAQEKTLPSKKYLEEQPATLSEEHNSKNETQSNGACFVIGDRPANSFWRRDYSPQIQLESPSAVENIDVYKGFERNTQHYPRVERSPAYRRRNPIQLVQIYPEEFENQYNEEGNPPPPEVDNDPHMGRMAALEEHERKVIIEFCHLLEKSKQLFNGLRELPQYGHKQWHSYFGRTFDVYTKLWKFQQQHRAVLDSKYGLKRWQIGEIASKIGQLYYHFYLRTSETAYLNEAFSFYYAIRGRSYYTKASKEDRCELMVKKLRYYARFIVVCLLLKKIKLVRDLIKELDKQIVEYGNTYDPDDQIEWTVVVDEVKAFIQTEPIVSVIHPDNYPVLLSHRLSPLTTPPVERSQQMNLSLQEVLIVGSCAHQVKFSELTMDMFRMLQTLEREPTGEIQHMYDDSPRQRFNLTPSALNNKGYNLETGAPRSDNPHKYLLFKPSPSQILVYLASGCNDLPPNGVLLLYISADGQIVQPSKHPEDGYDIGGLITTSKTELYRDGSKDKNSQAKNRELQCFHPGDLYPFTRRPLFIIIDSDNSVVFQNIPRHFGQPMVILMSPLELPPGLHISLAERKQQGSLFTLFLHSPLTAICYCADLYNVPLIHWDRAQAYIDNFLAEASQIVTRGRIDPMFLNFMGDDFLRLLILRYMFCELVLRMHRAFRTRIQRPRSAPSIPDEILEHPALVHIIFDLATHLQVRPSFQEPNGNNDRTSKE